MKGYYTIESDDFFKIQQKDLCNEFKGNAQEYSICIGSASSLSHDLMQSAGMFGEIGKAVNMRLGKIPMKISQSSINYAVARAKGDCNKWNLPSGAPEEQIKKTEKIVNACYAGVQNFVSDLLLVDKD